MVMNFFTLLYLFFIILALFYLKAKFQGQHINKWLLVNVQNSQEFSCQVLNRDVWSNQTVKDIINEHFIFWQVSAFLINCVISVINHVLP